MIFSKFTRGKEIIRWYILELVSTFFNQCLSGEHYRKEIKNLWPLKIDENRKWFFKNDKIPDLVLYNVAKIFLVSTVYLSTVIFLTTLMATRKYCKGTERDNLIFTLLLWPPALKTLNNFTSFNSSCRCHYTKLWANICDQKTSVSPFELVYN